MLGVAFLAGLPLAAKAAEWPSALSLSTLDGTTGFRLDGVAANDLSGNAVASAGDVNGDGFADLIVAAPGADTNGATAGDNQGSSNVVFGKEGIFSSTVSLSTLDGATGFRLDGVSANDFSGNAVSSAGDINGDGFADLIVGAYLADTNGAAVGNQQGSSYVVFGKSGGFASAISLSTLNGTTGFRLDGVADQDRSGRAVSAAGDVNGDGFADLIVGAYYADTNGATAGDNQGSSYVVFGKAGGFSSAISLSTLNGTAGFRLDGAAADDRSGVAVSSAGDVNGDGFADLIVGANGADTNGVTAGDYQGSSYVVFGKAGGFSSTVSLSTLNGITGFRLDGVAANDSSGRAVSSAGDFNGDGFADLIVGALGADTNGATAGVLQGSSFVVFGKAGGFASSVSLSTLNGTTGFRLNGVADQDRSGRAVSSAGDVNGDGFADLIVGAHFADSNGATAGVYQGSSYVMFGNAGGFASSVSLSTLNGTTGFRLDGVENLDNSGIAVSSAGDVNGDGFTDLIVGAYKADTNGATAGDNQGSSYVIFGREPDQSAMRIGSRAKQTIHGGDFVDVLVADNLGDTLEGREGGDVLVGDLATTASYAHAANGIAIDLAIGAGTGDAAGDSYFSIANLEGSSHADTLTGNGSANRLTGGKGRDALKGSGGKDTFGYRFSAESLPGAANSDVIADFNPGKKSTAVDKIDLSAIDANTTKGGNQAFTFRGTKAFNGKGQIRLKLSGKNVIIQGNTGGSSAPEFEIVLKSLAGKIAKITAKDFKL